MSYTKLDPQPTGLQPGETAVRMDSGAYVAIAAQCSVEPNSGNPVIASTARVINSPTDGTDKLDATGQPMHSAWQYISYPAELANLGNGDATAGMAVLQKCCLMAVLGEDTSPMWADPIHFTALQDASIRTNLASAAHAGPVNAGAIL